MALCLGRHGFGSAQGAIMKERPVLFSAPMVRAILDGSKTQTRRIIKEQGHPCIQRDCRHAPELSCDNFIVCPYGQIGDQLWVRETCEIFGFWVPKEPKGYKFVIHHDKLARYSDDQDYCSFGTPKGLYGGKTALDAYQTRPSIHTPRWASRIQLEITGVRVERLHDIKTPDIYSEGAITEEWLEWREDVKGIGMPSGSSIENERDVWQRLWSKINGSESWNSNPWVWVIEFKRVTP